MAKQILFDTEARQRVFEGVRKAAAVVKATLGPGGRNIILQKSFGKPVITRDGVTVAKEVELEEPFENMGAKMVKEVASKTNDVAGDGTTTASLLLEAIYAEGMKALAAGGAPVLLQRGIDKATAAVVAALEKMATPVAGKQIEQVATLAANHDGEIGRMIANAIEKAGKQGVITVEEGKGVESTLETVDGLQFDKGFISPYFITDAEAMKCVLEDVSILLYEKKLSSLRELVPALEKVAQAGRPILVIAEDVDGEALAALVINRLRGILKACAVKAPGFGDRRKAMLEDMAILTGGTFLSEDTGTKLENVTLDHLGHAEKVIVEKDKTTIVGGSGKKSAIEQRIKQIKAQIEKATSDYDKEKLEERLAKLSGGVAVVKVGGKTESEMKERQFRVDDALHATRAAVEEGIVPGGGVALLRAREAVEKMKLEGDERIGAQILKDALALPLKTIVSNAGENGSLAVAEILDRKEKNFGYDALSKKYGDMVEMGILDPLKVVRVALQNAAGRAGLMLTMETVITELKEKEKAAVGATA
ncbi:MAG TPA: chaperonin GroEL [Planctomycetota bacterium]|nr:chaperonin GroEL [Planctomycetota bacterium]